MPVTAMIIEEGDSVATCLEKVEEGGDVRLMRNGRMGETLRANQAIPYIHKICVKPLKKGEHCLKYGLSIGVASRDIEVGDYIHVHNIESARGRGDLA